MATQRQASIVAVAAAAVLGVGMYRMTGKSPEAPIKREQPGIKGAGAGTGRVLRGLTRGRTRVMATAKPYCKHGVWH